MATISAQVVKELRERTGAGMMECKRALEETGGDLEAAAELLRARGAAKAAKRADRVAKEGAVGAYVHHGGRIGVLVEVNCETDFVARTEEFQRLVRDLAMHIAAAAPIAVRREEVPADVLEAEVQAYRQELRTAGKPEAMWDRIIEGKLTKFYAEKVLLEQPFIRDPERTVGELVQEVSAKTGEKIEVRRFARFVLGA